MSKPEVATSRSGAAAIPETDADEDQLDRLVFDYAAMKFGDAISTFREQIGPTQTAIANLCMLAEYVGKRDRSVVFNDDGEPDDIGLDAPATRTQEAVKDYLQAVSSLWRASTERGLLKIAAKRLHRLCRQVEGSPAIWMHDSAYVVVSISNLRRQWHYLERASETIPVARTSAELKQAGHIIRGTNPLNGGQPFDIARYGLVARAFESGFSVKQIATALVAADLDDAPIRQGRRPSKSKRISDEAKRLDSFVRRLKA